MSTLKIARVALGATLATAASSTTHAAPGDIENLGSLSGSRETRAEDLNDAGDVVGWGQVPASPSGVARHAFVRPAAGGQLQDLGTFNGSGSSVATAVNNAGVTVGWADGISGSPERAFIRQPAGAVANLGVMNGMYSRAYGINDHGDVAGVVAYSPVTGSSMTDERGFLRRASDGAVIEIPRPTGARAYPAADVNDARDVVGTFYTSTSTSTTVTRGYLWRESTGTMIEFAAPGGDSSTRAEAINDRGDVVGYVHNPAAAGRAFVRRAADGIMTPLARPDGSGANYAYDINDAGVIVGAADFFPGTTHAILWDADGLAIDLDAWLDTVNPAAGALWTLHVASAVNASGLVAGTGTYNDGPDGLSDGLRPFLLDASTLVPEPTSASLLIPLAFLATRRARRPAPARPSP